MKTMSATASTSSTARRGFATRAGRGRRSPREIRRRGYPGRLEGADIPLTARVFAVADVFDALTSRRPYKAPLSRAEALGILIRGRGKHFDPEVVDVFASMAKDPYERYAHKTGSDLKAELIDMSWRYFQADAETLV